MYSSDDVIPWFMSLWGISAEEAVETYILRQLKIWTDFGRRTVTVNYVHRIKAKSNVLSLYIKIALQGIVGKNGNRTKTLQ